MLRQGCTVFLYEKKTLLLHLQAGCKTRWVHPNIYDWPEERAEYPYAELPILDWQENYAADVVEKVLHDYNKITSNPHYSKYYRECLESEYQVNWRTREVDLKKSSNSQHKKFTTIFDVIVVATGFGLESEIYDAASKSKQQANSYWRNDDLDQPYLDYKDPVRRIIISGTGDGACVDVLRSTFINFHQGKFINDIMSKCVDSDKLRSILSEIKLNFSSNLSDPLWLYNEFEKIPEKLLVEIKDYLRFRRRKIRM